MEKCRPERDGWLSLFCSVFVFSVYLGTYLARAASATCAGYKLQFSASLSLSPFSSGPINHTTNPFYLGPLIPTKGKKLITTHLTIPPKMNNPPPLVEIPESRFNTSASRSIDITLVNKTDKVLHWSDSGLDHGERKVTAPDTIWPERKGRWMLESNGFMTGAEGWMNWRIDENGSAVVKLEYNNPFTGSNGYSGWVAGDGSERYVVDREGGSGDNAKVVFTVRNRESFFFFFFLFSLDYFVSFFLSNTVNVTTARLNGRQMLPVS